MLLFQHMQRQQIQSRTGLLLGLASVSMEVHALPNPPQQSQHTDLITF